MAKISPLSLTLDQAERVEELSGIPADQWASGSKVRLLRAILAVSEGEELEAFADMTFGELIDRVSLEDPAPEGSGEPA